jgi:hypothetical protein
MVGEVVPPRWAKLVIVGGDAAYGSKANMAMVQERDKADPARRWGFVFAIARTWKTAEEKTIKNLVTHVPHTYYQLINARGCPKSQRAEAAEPFGCITRACPCVMWVMSPLS